MESETAKVALLEKTPILGTSDRYAFSRIFHYNSARIGKSPPWPNEKKRKIPPECKTNKKMFGWKYFVMGHQIFLGNFCSALSRKEETGLKTNKKK